MKQKYANRQVISITLIGIILMASACKKTVVAPTTGSLSATPTPLATLGLYEYASGANKRILIPITQVGTQTVNYYGIFDTGSSGLTIDATGILPASMITSSGITVTGDSVVVNGITVTSKTSIVSYGDQISSTKEYGNLAYATVTLGNQNGSITTKRIPMFLYYKIVDGTGKQIAAHAADVFGVGPGLSYANSAIASPLSYFTMPANVTSGFKLATLSSANFSSTGTFVTNLLTIGLTPTDLAASSGFIMHPLTYFSVGGYSANIPATITYGTTTVSNAQILFDTGTPSVTTIEDKNAVASIGQLPVNTPVTVVTNKGFRYQYVTNSTGNLTEIQNPNNTGDSRTIFALDFFISNEFLTDYTNHQIGLKNN